MEFVAGNILGLALVSDNFMEPVLIAAFLCFACAGFLTVYRATR
jgi:hypothetical protein